MPKFIYIYYVLILFIISYINNSDGYELVIDKDHQASTTDYYAEQYATQCNFKFKFYIYLNGSATFIEPTFTSPNIITSGGFKTIIDLFASDGVTNIGKYFDTNTISVALDTSGLIEVNVLGEIIGTLPFYECVAQPSSLTNLNANAGNPWYTYDNIIFYTYLKFNVTKFGNIATETQVNQPHACNYNLIGFDILGVECWMDFDVLNGMATSNVVFGIAGSSTVNLPTFVKPWNNGNPSVFNRNFYKSFENVNPVPFKRYCYYLLTVSHSDPTFPYIGISKNNVNQKPKIVLGNKSSYTLLLKTTILDNATSVFSFNSNYVIGNVWGTYLPNGFTSNGIRVHNIIDNFGSNINAPLSTAAWYLYNYNPFTYSITFGDPLQMYYGSKKMKYPYGIEIYNMNGDSALTLEVSLVASSIGYFQISVSPLGIIYITNTIPAITTPTLIDIEFLDSPLYTTVRITVNGNEGIMKVSLNQGEFELGPLDIISMDSTFTILEKVLDYSKITTQLHLVSIFSLGGKTTESKYSPKGGLPVFPKFNQKRVEEITYLRFTINDIDLTNIGCDNTLFINFTNANKFMLVKVVFKFGEEPVFIGKWNEAYKMFSVDFYLPQKLFTGEIPFTVYYQGSTNYLTGYPSISLPGWGITETLRVSSENADLLAPIITNIASFTTMDLGSILGGGWNFTIEDSLNGLKRAKFIVSNTYLPFSPLREFNFLTSEMNNVDIHNLVIKVEMPLLNYYLCNVQYYQISYIELEDYGGLISKYDPNNYFSEEDNSISPLMTLIENDPSIPLVMVCSDVGRGPADYPGVSYLSVYPSTPIDVFSSSRSIQVTFNLSNDYFGIATDSGTACYLQGLFFDILESKATFIGTYQNNSFHSMFTCSFNLPYGFGYPQPALYLAIHGIANRAYFNTGYSVVSLFSSYSSARILLSNAVKEPFIQSTSQLSTVVTDLTIFGKNFEVSTFTKVYLTYGNTQREVFPDNITLILMVVKNVAIEPVIKLSVFNGLTSLESNEIEIHPTIIPPEETKPPVVINPVCLNNCNKNGNCTFEGCVCSLPWFGIDCSSQTLVIPEPTVNISTPFIEQLINTSKSIENQEPVVLKSLISIMELKEIDINNKLVISHPFGLWEYKNTTNTSAINISYNRTVVNEYTYSTTLEYKNTSTKINVVIQYFKEDTTIYFATEQLNIFKSTLKYRIDIGPYPFNSSLNHLQLVMSAELETTTKANESCSYQEKGNLPSTHQEYIKLQVDNHSLFGRFIKRGIIDNRVQIVGNSIHQIVDKSSNKSNSFTKNNIGINIPNYKVLAIIDPDFSLLIDIKPAGSKKNSVCNSKDDSEDDSNKSKSLSKTQLAGIIIGAISTLGIAGAGIVYYIYQKNLKFKIMIFKFKEISTKEKKKMFL